MSTRCNIHFNGWGRTCANVYRHCDGYPEGVLPDRDTSKGLAMPRAICDDIRWDPNDSGYKATLPTDVDVHLDEGFDPDYEPQETVEREFGCSILSLNVDEIEE